VGQEGAIGAAGAIVLALHPLARESPHDTPLFDHLVRAQRDRLRERLCGLQIDDQFDFGGLLHGQTGGCRTIA
jgi:hypothetical protein